jgi:hypothetical protein
LQEAFVAVQAFDAAFKQVAFINLADAMNASEWKVYNGEVRLPSETKSVLLTVILKGGGRIWLDDVSIAPEPQVFPTSTSTQ